MEFYLLKQKCRGGAFDGNSEVSLVRGGALSSEVSCHGLGNKPAVAVVVVVGGGVVVVVVGGGGGGGGALGLGKNASRPNFHSPPTLM